MSAMNIERERDPEKEYLVKATMLVKLHELVTWPEMQPKWLNLKRKNEVTISVIGTNPFPPKAQQQFKLASNEHVQYVLQVRDKPPTKFCHIAFIAEDKADEVDDILRHFGPTPTLTVSDIPGFAKMGGDIEFFLFANRVTKMLVNEQAAIEKGLAYGREMYSGIAAKFIHKLN